MSPTRVNETSFAFGFIWGRAKFPQADSSLIPSNITTSCSTFLNQVNSDTTLSACVQPLINATSSFSPTIGSNLSSTDTNLTLATLCNTNSGCSDSIIRSLLSSFYSSCSDELTSSAGYNAQVRELYDILYVVNPLKGAVCSIDSSNQDYCVHEIIASQGGTTSKASSTASAASASASGNATMLVNFANTHTWSPVSFAAENLYITITTSASALTKRFLNLISTRDAAQSVNLGAIITPNSTTYRTTNLPFLFLQPDMSQSALCTPCTREIMVAYIKWESAYPYALGLSNSPILGGQSSLWSAINSTCGGGFVNAITSEVGTFAVSSSGNSTSSADSRLFAASGQALATAAVGIAFVAGAMALFA